MTCDPLPKSLTACIEPVYCGSPCRFPDKVVDLNLLSSFALELRKEAARDLELVTTIPLPHPEYVLGRLSTIERITEALDRVLLAHGGKSSK